MEVHLNPQNFSYLDFLPNSVLKRQKLRDQLHHKLNTTSQKTMNTSNLTEPISIHEKSILSDWHLPTKFSERPVESEKPNVTVVSPGQYEESRLYSGTVLI